MKTTIHLGAHRTGTSHIQSVLQQVALPGTAVAFRNAPLVQALKRGDREAVAEEMARVDAARLLISDENLLRRLAGLTGPVLYAHAMDRFEGFRRCLSGCTVEFVLYVRDYADFAESIFSKIAQEETRLGAAPHRWDDFVAARAFHPARLTWVPLVERLRESFPDARIVVAVYRPRGADAADHMRRFLGLIDHGLPALPEETFDNASLSREAIDAVRRAELPSDEAGRMSALRAARQRQGRRLGRLQYVPPEAAREAEENFARHLEEIATLVELA